jgi:hypothetical protein
MNLDDNPTIEQLRELVRQRDDSAGHHILWVKKTGEVEISCIPRDKTPDWFEKKNHPEMQLRLETFQAGNEYVGPDAAADDAWIAELFQRLGSEWQQAKGKPEVAYIGQF